MAFIVATEAPPEAEKLLQFLLVAVRDGRYDDFILPGTETFREGITREMVEKLSAQVAPRLRAGHTTHYQAETGNCEHRVFLWNVRFSDGGALIARLVMTAELHVAGFMLN